MYILEALVSRFTASSIRNASSGSVWLPSMVGPESLIEFVEQPPATLELSEARQHACDDGRDHGEAAPSTLAAAAPTTTTA